MWYLILAASAGPWLGYGLWCLGWWARRRGSHTWPLQEGLRLEVDSVQTASGCESPGTTLLSNINASMQSGELCAIMGPSGSGKTTLLNVLNQTTGHSVDGAVWFQGEVATVDLMRRVSYLVPVASTLFGRWTVRETLRFYCHDAERVHGCLAELGLEACDDRLVECLSTGQHKRLQIGIGLLQDAALLLLDEPTSGLSDSDAIDVVRICAGIARRKLVIMVIHQPSLEIFQL